jgi:hypothetical protein
VWGARENKQSVEFIVADWRAGLAAKGLDDRPDRIAMTHYNDDFVSCEALYCVNDLFHMIGGPVWPDDRNFFNLKPDSQCGL